MMPELTQHITPDQYYILLKKYEQLLMGAARMRSFQKEWEAWHASVDKEKKRVWEREVDKLLAKEKAERDQQQKTIF